MISAPVVKRLLLDLVQARGEFATVSCLYGQPESASDVSGTHPFYSQLFTFEEPAGELVVDEMCGPGRQDYREQWTANVIIQVIGRDRDADFEVVENRRAQLLWETVQVLQDPTLGFVAADDTRVSRIFVELGQVENVSGWNPASGSNLAACRSHVELVVEAQIENEA